MERLHRPVMTNEVLDFIKLKSGGVYADLTFGEGGHSELFLSKDIARLIATDRDPIAVQAAQSQEKWAKEERFELVHTEFSGFSELAKNIKFDGMLVDLGVSTRQLLEGVRGFSFSSPGPLDMRMDTSKGSTLAEILAGISEEDLADALWMNADLTKSRSIARNLLRKFQRGEITTTADIAKIMGPARPGRSHPATPLFLALRMLVNQEMDQINSLPSLIPLLKPGGRLVVLTFHSSEDRRVKKLFKRLAGLCTCEETVCCCPKEALVKILTSKPLQPTDAEITENPRARSTKLRAVERL